MDAVGFLFPSEVIAALQPLSNDDPPREVEWVRSTPCLVDLDRQLLQIHTQATTAAIEKCQSHFRSEFAQWRRTADMASRVA
jgi:hypothetical protein